MNRVELHRVAALGKSSDERYMIEVFDDRQSERKPVALGYALWRAQEGVCCLNMVSRGADDGSHTRAAWVALESVCRP
jgi:hypothetical protein